VTVVAMEILPKLTPTQALLLRAAARRADGRVILPANLRGGARVKAVKKLNCDAPVAAMIRAWPCWAMIARRTVAARSAAAAPRVSLDEKTLRSMNSLVQTCPAN